MENDNMCIVRYIVIIGAMLLTKAMCGDMPFSEIMTIPITYDSRQYSVEKETPQNFVGPRSSSTHSMSKNKPIPRRQIFSWDEWTPIQISFFYIKLFSDKTPVYGLNLGVVNTSEYVYGLTFGLYNHLNANNGIIIGIINDYIDNNGLALACLANVGYNGTGSIALFNFDNSHLFQIGILNTPMPLAPGNGTKFQGGVINVTEKGILQVAIINYSNQESLLQIGGYNGSRENDGVQIGCLNGTVENNGVQIGLFNVSETHKSKILDDQKKSRGWQFGFFNISDNRDIQIGLLNYNPTALIPWMPFFNWSPPDTSKESKNN